MRQDLHYSYEVKEKRLKYRKKCLVPSDTGHKYNNINFKLLSTGDI